MTKEDLETSEIFRTLKTLITVVLDFPCLAVFAADIEIRILLFWLLFATQSLFISQKINSYIIRSRDLSYSLALGLFGQLLTGNIK